MRRAMIEQHLTETEQHIAHGEHLIAEQLEIIETCNVTGTTPPRLGSCSPHWKRHSAGMSWSASEFSKNCGGSLSGSRLGWLMVGFGHWPPVVLAPQVAIDKIGYQSKSQEGDPGGSCRALSLTFGKIDVSVT